MSLAERIGFGVGFVLVGAATVVLLSAKRTHNLLVPGSNPGGPTKILNVRNEFPRGSVVLTSFTGVELRGVTTRWVRSRFHQQPLSPVGHLSQKLLRCLTQPLGKYDSE